MDYNQRRKEQARQTEQAILQAAADLSRRQSFDRVTIRDICRAAGITTGAFYHHFSSTEELLVRGFAPLDAHMERSMAGHEGEPPVDRLWLLLSTYARFIEDEGCELVARYYDHRITNPSFASMDPTRFTHRAMLGCLRDAADQGLLAGLSPEWVADFLFRHFRGVVIDWLLHQGSYPLLPKLEQDYDFFAQILQRESIEKPPVG